MASGDRERWNERWRGQTVGPPSAWLQSLAPLLPPRGRALDVAGGPGRNAVWLAQRGLEVTLVDVSDEALALAAALAATTTGVRLQAIQADLERDPLPPGPWDLILCIHYLDRALLPRLAAALAPDGLLVFAQPTYKNLERNPRPGGAYLLAEGEAPSLVPGLSVVTFEEDWIPEGRHEARLVARAGPPPTTDSS